MAHSKAGGDEEMRDGSRLMAFSGGFKGFRESSDGGTHPPTVAVQKLQIGLLGDRMSGDKSRFSMHQAGRETFPSYVLDSLGEAGVAEEDFVLIHRVVWGELLRSDRGYRLQLRP